MNVFAELSSIADFLDTLSCQAWYRIPTARQFRMSYGEVTITENNLLSLSQFLNNRGITIRKFRKGDIGVGIVPSKNDEWITGADLEIWLTYDYKVIGYVFQAKRILVTGKYDDIYRYDLIGKKSGKGNKRQMMILEEYAKSRKAYPYHLLYNGWSANSIKPPSLPGNWISNLFGCAAIPTPLVIAADNGYVSQKAAPFLSNSIPWSELFRPHCPGIGRSANYRNDNDGSVPNVIDNLVRKSNDAMGGEKFERAETLPSYVVDEYTEAENFYLGDCDGKRIFALPKCAVHINLDLVDTRDRQEILQ